MKEIIGSFVTINFENFDELKTLFETNGYELAVRTQQGKITEIFILSKVEEVEEIEESQDEEVKE